VQMLLELAFLKTDFFCLEPPWWSTAYEEINVPSAENPQLEKVSPLTCLGFPL